MICNSCGGVINRDCWNPQECAEITAQMRNDEVKMYGQELIEGIRAEVCELQSENTAMRETIQKMVGALRSAKECLSPLNNYAYEEVCEAIELATPWVKS